MQENLTSAGQQARPALPSAVPTVEVSERPWGNWSLLYEGAGVKVKLIEVRPGHRLSLQYHRHRSEFWVCIAGRASAQIGDRTRVLAPHETVFIPTGALHRLGNSGPETVMIVEVQRGDLLSEDDIVRVEDDYHRETQIGHR